jgi:murein L,D-transpeptidase YafK
MDRNMSSLVTFRLLSGLPLARRSAPLVLSLGLIGALSGCNSVDSNRAMQALSSETTALLAEKGVSADAPMLIRAYKKESELEVWKMRPDGSYVLIKAFPICRWSGQLGPKHHEGDRQSPEGFYSITPAQMNPNSSYYLSFNVGYPNAYDRAHGATGGAVMVHGVCSSAGCFSMTDQQIAEIYALARESFAGGQHAIQMQAYPFHLNAKNLAKFRLDPNMPFWKELKKGADHFEATHQEVSVGVCGGHYVFGAKSANGQPLDAEAPCPALRSDPAVESLVAERERADEREVAELAAKGERPVRLVYKDGAQHPFFANRVPDVGNAQALTPPIELALDESDKDARPRKAPLAVAVKMARDQAGADAEKQASVEADRAPRQTQSSVTSFSNDPLRASSEKIASVLSLDDRTASTGGKTIKAENAVAPSSTHAAKAAAPQQTAIPKVAKAHPPAKPTETKPQAALPPAHKVASAIPDAQLR